MVILLVYTSWTGNLYEPVSSIQICCERVSALMTHIFMFIFGFTQTLTRRQITNGDAELHYIAMKNTWFEWRDRSAWKWASYQPSSYLISLTGRTTCVQDSSQRVGSKRFVLSLIVVQHVYTVQPPNRLLFAPQIPTRFRRFGTFWSLQIHHIYYT